MVPDPSEILTCWWERFIINKYGVCRGFAVNMFLQTEELGAHFVLL